MTPETNHDVEISIYHDFLEDQGVIVDRGPELQDQWCYEYKYYSVVGGVGVGGFRVSGGVIGGFGGFRVGGGVIGVGGFVVGGIGVNISGSVGG